LVATPGYFRTLHIPVKRGRDFSESDREDSPLVAIVNESFAKRWLGPDPLRARIMTGDDRPRQVIGVVGDVRFQELAGKPLPAYFLPATQTEGSGMNFLVRSAGDAPIGTAMR